MKIREFDVSFSIFGPETPSLLGHFYDTLIFEFFNQITITINLNYTIISQNTHNTFPQIAETNNISKNTNTISIRITMTYNTITPSNTVY